MFGFNKYILIGGAVLIALLAGAVWLQQNRIESLNRDVATERANVQTLKNAIAQQEQAQKLRDEQEAKDRAAMAELHNRLSDAVQERDAAVSRLNAFRGRLEKAAKAKPGLVGDRATRATRRLMCDILRAGGGHCADEAAGAPGTPATGAGSAAGR